MKRASLTGICCIGVFAIASATKLDVVTIKRVLTKNQVYSYTMTGTIDFQGATHEIGAKETDTITDIAADGTYTTKSEQTDFTFDGSAAPVSGGATISVNKPNGELVSVKSDQNPDQGRMATLTQFYYPTTPVSVGDTWSFTGTKNETLGILGFKADMKLLGDEKIGAIDTWKIQEDVKETAGTSPATLHSTVWVDKTDGSMVKAESSFTDLPGPGGVTLSGKMNFVRAK